MLKAADFYEAVPEFGYLAETAASSHQMYLDQRDCTRCHQEWKFMRGVGDAAFLKFKQLKDEDPRVLDKIKAWLAKRKGYAISTVVLYYRSSMKGKLSEFKF
jgi:predicted  nucleic acid-binding Zn ribbon protein